MIDPAAASLLFADIMFLGVDGIELNQGLTCSHPQEAEVLRMLARHSKHLVVARGLKQDRFRVELAVVPYR